ncbi:MAG: ABC transporter substrate-binding protein, partial [Bacillota bacterium]
EKAVGLLEDAGWTEMGDDGVRRNADGDRLTVTVVTGTGDTLREDVMLIAQQNLAEIGLELRSEFYEWSVLLNQYLDVAQFQAYLLSWSLSTDPDAFITFHSSAGVNDDGQLVGFNDVEYSNPRVDELLELGRTTMDEEERRQIYLEIQDILNEDLPYVFLFSRDLVAAVDKDIKGVVMTGIGSLYPERWYIETESVAASD